jgi:Txe/YoeB family toxin of Txe-Axe toxin-antitoxin module
LKSRRITTANRQVYMLIDIQLILTCWGKQWPRV